MGYPADDEPSSQNHPHLVSNLRLSSVGPGRVTGSEVVHHFTHLDLAMKLHYLKGVYYFTKQAVEGLSLTRMKELSFSWLCHYYATCGRLKRADSGRPYIKCNDCGVRFAEGSCDRSLDEWLESADDSLHDQLVYHRPIGPELSFSPLVYIQVTRFKCGGMSVGMSWAHILGDAFSASEFITRWGQCQQSPIDFGQRKLPGFTQFDQLYDPTRLPNATASPLSVKRVDPVGDLWVTPTNCKMTTFSLPLTKPQLSSLQAKISSGNNPTDRILLFESVVAVIWQCIAKVREGISEPPPQTVTVCRKPDRDATVVLSNSQKITVIKADVSVAEADLKTLVSLLAEDQGTVEIEKIEAAAAIENDDDGTTADYIMYGANLTFVNLENAAFYEFKWKGNKPMFAYYSIQGVGDDGAVLFLPGPQEESELESMKGIERLVNITLPEDQVWKLKIELEKSGLIVARELE